MPRETRRLAEPPSARYSRPEDRARPGPVGPGGTSSALSGPLVRAVLVGVAGAVALTIVGAILASTFGLLFVAGASGAAIGLVLSRAAVPPADVSPVPRARLRQIAVGLSLGAVAVAAVLTWIVAKSEGGTLGLVDYLLATFGPFVPAEAVVAALAAWWGASTGPIQA